MASSHIADDNPNTNVTSLPDIPTSPLELSEFQQSAPGAERPTQTKEETASSTIPAATSEHPAASESTHAAAVDPAAAPAPEQSTKAALPPPPIQPVRKFSEALGPATESPIVPPTTGVTALTITLQLTTGARHPYKIDEKYLTSRKVEAKNAKGEFEPLELSGYKLKELIWTDWRSEWEPRPASPSSIRLIYLGKLLEDNRSLSEYNVTADSPNIIHMTVKPADFDDDEAAAKGGKGSSIRHRDSEERTAGCRCVIL